MIYFDATSDKLANSSPCGQVFFVQDKVAVSTKYSAAVQKMLSHLYDAASTERTLYMHYTSVLHSLVMLSVKQPDLWKMLKAIKL